MNKYLKLFLWNVIFLTTFIACLFFPQYIWSIKFAFYIILFLGFMGKIYWMNNLKEVPKEYEYKDKLYLTSDYIFDIIFLVFFVIFNLKLLFIVYIISVLFTISLRSQLSKLGENND